MNAVNWEVGSTWYADNFRTESGLSNHLHKLVEGDDFTLLSTCRSAISIILQTIGHSGRALVPSFTCLTVVSPFINAGYEVRGYPVKENLEIDIDGLSKLVDSFRPNVILIHSYFGFDTVSNAAEYLAWCRAQGIIIVEDRTQTMFSSFIRPEPDYTIGSIRKWLPVPDGAFLSGLRIQELNEDSELAEAKIKAMRAKHSYIFYGKGDKDEFMPQFSMAEHMLDLQASPHAISKYTLSALDALDSCRFAVCRRNNYNTLINRLLPHHELSVIFQNASEVDVPFLLPIYMTDGRKDFQAYMARHNVYPTIIWTCPVELDKAIASESRKIYDKILCFHVDQRYDTNDMNRVADIIDSYFEQ